MKKRIKKRIPEGESSAATYAGIIKSLATPRTPEKRAAVRTLFQEKKVRRTLDLDVVEAQPHQKPNTLGNQAWKRKISHARAKKASMRQRIKVIFFFFFSFEICWKHYTLWETF